MCWYCQTAMYDGYRDSEGVLRCGHCGKVVTHWSDPGGDNSLVLKEFSLTTGDESLCKCGHRHYLGASWKESGEFVKKGDKVVKVGLIGDVYDTFHGYIPPERILLDEGLVVQEALSCGGAILSNVDIVDWEGNCKYYKVFKVVSKTPEKTVIKSFSGKETINFDRYGKEVVTLHKKRWNSGRAKRCIDHNPCARRVL